VVEGVGLHVWTASRSEFWAWTITALNLATPVWLWRDYQARLRAKLTLGENEVVVALGNQLRCRFPRSAIASAGRGNVAVGAGSGHGARLHVNTANRSSLTC
jgi:hypothetical protein